RQEWAYFLSAVRDNLGLNPGEWLCVDIEDSVGMQYARDYIAKFASAAVVSGYPNGLIYTRQGYADACGIDASILPLGWRNLWLADYSTYKTDPQIEVPKGWTRDKIIARQYTDGFTYPVNIPGIGVCDYSRTQPSWPGTLETEMPLDD